MLRQKVHVVLHGTHDYWEFLSKNEAFCKEYIMMHRVMIDYVYISGISCRALLDVLEKRGHYDFIEGVVQVEVVVVVVSVIQSCVALKDSDCLLIRRASQLEA